MLRCCSLVLLALVGCAGDSVAPEWWEDAATTTSPVGGAWHYEDGRCLFTGAHRVEWAGVENRCTWTIGEDGARCAINPEDAYTLAPFHAADGYVGGVWFEAPDGEVLPMQPGCWRFGP